MPLSISVAVDAQEQAKRGGRGNAARVRKGRRIWLCLESAKGRRGHWRIWGSGEIGGGGKQCLGLAVFYGRLDVEGERRRGWRAVTGGGKCRRRWEDLKVQPRWGDSVKEGHVYVENPEELLEPYAT